MSFADHLQRGPEGEYDLDAAEAERAIELANSPDDLIRLAEKAAKSERSAWSRSNTASLRKQFSQPALSPDLELEVLVPLGESVAVELGDMDDERIPKRKDLRTKSHLDELNAFGVEMTFWMDTEQLIDPGQTIREAIDGGAS